MIDLLPTEAGNLPQTEEEAPLIPFTVLLVWSSHADKHFQSATLNK